MPFPFPFPPCGTYIRVGHFGLTTCYMAYHTHTHTHATAALLIVVGCHFLFTLSLSLSLLSSLSLLLALTWRSFLLLLLLLLLPSQRLFAPNSNFTFFDDAQFFASLILSDFQLWRWQTDREGETEIERERSSSSCFPSLAPFASSLKYDKIMHENDFINFSTHNIYKARIKFWSRKCCLSFRYALPLSRHSLGKCVCVCARNLHMFCMQPVPNHQFSLLDFNLNSFPALRS